jgi:hypothetical protein
MNSQIAAEFRWLSPLGISVILFSLYGLLSLVVGVVIPLILRKATDLPGNILFLSQRTDTTLFGRVPSELIAEDSVLATLRFLMINWLGGLWLCFGIFQLALTWFGLRAGQVWALVTLTLADLLLIPYFVRIIRVYTGRGVHPNMVELPPLFSLQVIVPIAAILGWIGLNS